MLTPQNGQTHSNNSSAVADELSVFDHFVGFAPKRLTYVSIYHLEIKSLLESAHISLPCIPQKLLKV